MLYRLISRTDRAAFDTEVVSLIDIGFIGRRIQALGVPVWSLGMQRGLPDPLAILRLVHWLRRDPPDVIQTWMYHADLVGGLAAKLAGRIPVAWGIRHSTLNPKGTKRMTFWTAMACARLSSWLPARIVCCSEVARLVHVQLGYADDKIMVIPNGFDLEEFRPDPTARQIVRQELGIPKEVPLIGLVARFHPQKDHRNFIQASAILQARLPECHFLLCGDRITWENSELTGWIEAAGVRDRFHLLGAREDIPCLMAALDISSTSAAYGEAFPNVIGESMACGVPCVATDVGDAGIIVGDTGVIVRPADPEALADGWAKLLMNMGREERLQLGLAGRQRISERYSLESIVRMYERLYESLGVRRQAESIRNADYIN